MQEFSNNLDVTDPAVITKCTRKPYTKISFKPDYARMGINGLDDTMRAIFQKRVFDIAAITDKKCKVRYNGEELPVRNLQQYVDLYIGPRSDAPKDIRNQRRPLGVCGLSSS